MVRAIDDEAWSGALPGVRVNLGRNSFGWNNWGCLPQAPAGGPAAPPNPHTWRPCTAGGKAHLPYTAALPPLARRPQG